MEIILYPHELALLHIRKAITKNKKLLKYSILGIGFGLLVISTGGTTILCLAYPSQPEVGNGILAGIIITTILAFAITIVIEDKNGI